MSRARTLDLLIAALLCAAKAAAGWAVLRAGFSHVSDDDYARVVIAQGFAHAPKLDPSGTSWLPFPFWVQGVVMMIFGRSLEVARATSFVVGTLSILPPFFMARAIGVPRAYAAIGALLGGLTAWNAWLGVATVPEALAASLTATGMIALVRPRAHVWGAACLLVAALSRYEAWPVCAVYGAVLGWRWWKTRARAGAWPLAIAIAGPAAWMAWNAATHGDALHFFARVSKYHEAIAGGESTWARIAMYPGALLHGAPELALVGLVGAIAFARRRFRARWSHAMLCSGALLAFLVLGNVRGGAPTHHPERALVALWWIAALVGGEAAGRTLTWFVRAVWKDETLGRDDDATRRPSSSSDRVFQLGCMSVMVALPLAFVVLYAASTLRVEPRLFWKDYPGRGEADRSAQIAKGRELAATQPRAVHLYPCAYEHLALIAAFGAPEKVTSEPASPASEGASCPRVEITP